MSTRFPNHYRTEGTFTMISQALLLQRTRAFTIALLAFPVVSASHGASFDCAKATTLVENAICSDPQLSALDDTLSKAYRHALDAAAAADEIKASQRSWMKKRNTCQDAACLKTVYSQRVAELTREGAPAASGNSKTADQQALPVGRQADTQDAGEAIRIGAVSDAAIVSGCSCTVNPVLENGKIDAGRCILFDDFSGTATMNLDGREVILSEVGKQRVTDSSRPCYLRQGCRYSAGGVTADVTYRRSGDDYDVTIKLEKGARRQRIQGKAVCGC